MAVALEELSKELNIPVEDLRAKSIQAFLEREIRIAEEDIADLRERYNVIERAMLEQAIKEGTIPSHPAWEDIIVWENLEDYLSVLKKNLGAIKT